MSDDATWIAYADENLAVAQLSLNSGYYNACLQNGQQAVEKYLKAALLRENVPFKKTHSVSALRNLLVGVGVSLELTDDDCDLLDAIYLPSKYPLGSALPCFSPDETICRKVVEMALRVQRAIVSSR